MSTRPCSSWRSPYPLITLSKSPLFFDSRFLPENYSELHRSGPSLCRMGNPPTTQNCTMLSCRVFYSCSRLFSLAQDGVSDEPALEAVPEPYSRSLSQVPFHGIHTLIMMCDLCSQLSHLGFQACHLPCQHTHLSLHPIESRRAPLIAATIAFASGDNCITGVIAVGGASRGTTAISSVCSRTSSVQCFSWPHEFAL